MSDNLSQNIQKVVDREIQFLDHLAAKVLEHLERKYRQKLEQTITEKVHERDASKQLLIDKI